MLKGKVLSALKHDNALNLEREGKWRYFLSTFINGKMRVTVPESATASRDSVISVVIKANKSLSGVVDNMKNK